MIQLKVADVWSSSYVVRQSENPGFVSIFSAAYWK